MSDQTHLEDRYIVVGVDCSHGSKAALDWPPAPARLTGAVVEAVAAWQQPATYEYSYGASPFPSPGDSTQHAPCPVIVVPDGDNSEARP